MLDSAVEEILVRLESGMLEIHSLEVLTNRVTLEIEE